MKQFREAVEARDAQAMQDLLADDVVFTSPVAFKPYPGKAITSAILRGVLRVFEGFRYVREIGAPDASDHALMFQAKVGDKDIEGCDFIRTDENGAISELTVMVRPLSAPLTLAEKMKERLAAS